MNETSTLPIMALPIDDIIQVAQAANGAGRPYDELKETEFISALARNCDTPAFTSGMTMSWDLTVPNATVGGQQTAGISALANARWTASACAANSLDWMRIGDDLTALSPSTIRETYQAIRSEQSPDAALLVGALTWRYLATRLAMLWAAERPLASGWNVARCCFDETQHAERSLVQTAKVQRDILGDMLLHSGDTEFVSGSTTLAVKARNAAPSNSFLVTVNACATKNRARELISRAQTALGHYNDCGKSHIILILDHIYTRSARALQCKSYDNNLHLIGNPDEARFVILVSDVNDSKYRQTPHEDDAYEGRFRLDKSLLRDVFLGRRNEDVFSQRTARDLGTPRRTSLGASTNLVFDLSTLAKASAVEGTSDGNTLISTGRIAREFFGYRGLPDPDPQ